jgi:hypothetical protein
MRTNPDNYLLEAIREKESAKQKALADAAELQRQIAVLRDAMKIAAPTEYEKYLKTKHSAVNETSEAEDGGNLVQLHSQKTTERNPKGALTPAIIDLLKDGRQRNIDEIYEGVNEKLNRPTTRDSVRATLGSLKNSRKIANPSYGKYALGTQEGESPTDLTATNSGGGAFNV